MTPFTSEASKKVFTFNRHDQLFGRKLRRSLLCTFIRHTCWARFFFIVTGYSRQVIVQRPMANLLIFILCMWRTHQPKDIKTHQHLFKQCHFRFLNAENGKTIDDCIKVYKLNGPTLKEDTKVCLCVCVLVCICSTTVHYWNQISLRECTETGSNHLTISWLTLWILNTQTHTLHDPI